MCLCAEVLMLRSSQKRLYFRIAHTYIRRSSTFPYNFNWNVIKPDLDVNYLCNANNVMEISDNIHRRKASGNIKALLELKAKLDNTKTEDSNYHSLVNNFYNELNQIPNKTHPDVLKLGDEPNVLKYVGDKRSFKNPPKEFHEITKRLRLVRTDQLGNVSGNRSYYLLGEMAELEEAIIRYSLNSLIRNNFNLVTVPDVLHRNIIEGCGMNTKGTRNQVYSVDTGKEDSDLCLSGTSEMALAGLYMNKTVLEKDLPIKLAAVSRCYRAETSSMSEERGIYRVHEFTKVEMFVLTKPSQSDEMLEEIRSIQENNFAALGLHFQVLDMPPHELGAPAYRKYDIEAWLPGRNIYGEISSCSNCTEFQSRRLGIKYSLNDELGFVHTVNGTACAVPRMLIALVETFQNENGTISVPDILQRFMRGKMVIGVQKRVPDLKLIKHKR